eukprot:TRINITY_DN4657_c0_g1_i1.p1 TRINITY_DN4657_c0_g1~~TRINITY_DN4657_c0_g1_i1.p1  ORF type:complete len:764 (+),score=244.42 TRINITY_DN4657_c0_g1_i1:80-2293(+)
MRRLLGSVLGQQGARGAAAADFDVSTPAARVDCIRKLMTQAGVDAYMVLSADPHQSEYLAPHFRRRDFLTGFTGTAGTCIVTQEKALLWTDSRYWTQAAQQLDSKVWELMKHGDKDVKTPSEFVASELKDGMKLGFDADCCSAKMHELMQKKIKDGSRRVELVSVSGNLVDQMWAEQPELPSGSIRVHDIKFAGKSVVDKLDEVAKELKKKQGDSTVLCDLDDVAWLFNLRGADLPNTPIFFGYAIVFSDGKATLMVDPGRLTEPARASLGDRVVVKPYSSLYAELGALKGRVLYDDWQTSVGIQQALAQNAQVTAAPERSIVSCLKMVKNDTELDGMRACHRRDGLALCRYLMWLEEGLREKQKITEFEGAEKLLEFRKAQEHFLCPSFPTISSSGPNAAVIHYRPEADTCREITTSEIYLCDSGGQYHDGTTDVTRTVHFGSPSAKEKEVNTLILKGVISLTEVTCPEECQGYRLDSLARSALWQHGLDFGHSTGHGVGSSLSVHEGPFSITPRAGDSLKPMKVGCVVSNEPGYYEAGAFGIRIENLMAMVPKQTKYVFNNEKFAGFETLTMVPLDAKLIDPKLITAAERRWIDQYHARVRDALLPLAVGDAALGGWITARTAPLARQHQLLRDQRERDAAKLSSDLSLMRAQLAELEQRKRASQGGPAAPSPKRPRQSDGTASPPGSGGSPASPTSESPKRASPKKPSPKKPSPKKLSPQKAGRAESPKGKRQS